MDSSNSEIIYQRGVELVNALCRWILNNNRLPAKTIFDPTENTMFQRMKHLRSSYNGKGTMRWFNAYEIIIDSYDLNYILKSPFELDEFKERKSIQSKLRWENPEYREKQKQGIAHLNRSEIVKKSLDNPESRRKLSESGKIAQNRPDVVANRKTRMESPEYKEKISGANHHNAKIIERYDLITNQVIETYHGGHQLLMQQKFDPRAVYDCCNGKKSKYKEFGWRYV